MSDFKLSVCLTTYCRYQWTVNAIEGLLDDDRIDDIVILDDDSPDNSYRLLVEHYKGIQKVRVIKQVINMGMSRNKRDCLAYARNGFALIGDSDNVFNSSYIDAIEALGELNENTIYQPCFGEINFDWRKYEGIEINRHNIKNFMDDALFRCSLNGCNYIVNPKLYCERYIYNPEIKEADTIWFLYQWLEQGGSYYIVPNMRYIHTVHPESGFLSNIEINMKHAIDLENKISQLN